MSMSTSSWFALLEGCLAKVNIAFISVVNFILTQHLIPRKSSQTQNQLSCANETTQENKLLLSGESIVDRNLFVPSEAQQVGRTKQFPQSVCYACLLFYEPSSLDMTGKEHLNNNECVMCLCVYFLSPSTSKSSLMFPFCWVTRRVTHWLPEFRNIFFEPERRKRENSAWNTRLLKLQRLTC
jgi:hypothetical protein